MSDRLINNMDDGDVYVAIIDEATTEIIDDYTVRLTKAKRRSAKVELVAELNKEFTKKFPNIKEISDIIAFGETDEIQTSVLKKFVDVLEFNYKDSSIGGKGIRACRCFRHKYGNTESNELHPNFMFGNTPIHEDYHASWKCLMIELREPKFVLIYKVKKDGKK